MSYGANCSPCSNRQSDYTRPGLIFAVYYLLLSFEFVAITSGVSVGRIAAIAIVLFSFTWISRWRFRLDPTGFALSAFVYTCLLSLFFLPDAIKQYGSYFTVLLNVILVFASNSIEFDVSDIDLWKRSLIFAAIFLGLAAIVSPGQVGTEWVSGRIVPNIAGSQQDPNEFCGYYLLPISFFVYQMVSCNRIAYSIPLSFLIYTVLMTGSRGGLIAVVVSILVAIICGIKVRKRKALVCVLALIVVLLLAFNADTIIRLLPDSISSRFLFKGGRIETASSRVVVWKQILDSFFASDLLQQLFGHGFGSTTLANMGGIVAHNVYIELLYDVGLLGLASFLALFFVSIYKAAIRRDFVVLSALIGESVLIMSLSSFWSKTLWGLIILGSVSLRKVESGKDESQLNA